MVQLVNSGNFGPVSESRKLPVKLEIEDSLDEEHGPLNKRAKFSVPFHQQWSTGDSNTTPHPAQYNPLNEPSPLGLRLRKSPSLLDLIQMRLSQVNAATVGAASGENLELGKMKDAKCNGVSGTTEKLKASNFPVSLLRIGTWECISRYEGDLVAKCYFAKHKLVWEVLEGGLKNKMEIQWSDITALKATCPENGPGTLDVVLARPPLFFRETNPQPRKHTLWQATTDFTGGQASMHRRHCLQCPQGLLSKHFEKLIQCDPRLKLLSQQPEVVLDSPYFEARVSFFEDQTEAKSCVLNHMKTEYVSTFSSFQDSPSPSVAQSSSSGSELRHPVSRASEAASLGSPSPCSVMDTQATEDNGGSETKEQKEPNQWDQLKFHGLHSSMSMSDLVNHIGNRISEHMTSANPLLSSQAHSRSREMLDEITQYLLSDSQCASTSTSDEQPLMSRVNSLCCLLQKDPATIQKPRNEGRLGGGGSETKEQKEPNQWGQLKFRGLHSSMSISDLVNQIGNCISEQMTSANPLLSSQARSRSREMLDEITQYLLSDSQCASTSDEQPLMSRVNSLCCLLQKDPATIQKLRNEGRLGGEDCMNGQPNSVPESTCGDTLASDGSGCKQLPAISRKESFGELLLHLPRIASMPQFLFNIAEDGDNQAR